MGGQKYDLCAGGVNERSDKTAFSTANDVVGNSKKRNRARNVGVEPCSGLNVGSIGGGWSVGL